MMPMMKYLALPIVGVCVLALGMAVGSQAFPRIVVEEAEVEKPMLVTRTVERVVVEEYPVYITKEVEVARPLRHFKSTEEFRDLMERYTEGMTVFGGNCVDLSLFLVGVARNDGFYVDTELLEGRSHMAIKGFCDAGGCQSIEFYDPEGKRFWTIPVPAGTYILPVVE